MSYLGGDGADFGSGWRPTRAGTPTPWAKPLTAASFPLEPGHLPSIVGDEDFWIAKVATTADLSLTKTASPTTGTVGQPLTYTLKASNAGPLAATNVTIADVLQTGADFVSANASQAPPVRLSPHRGL